MDLKTILVLATIFLLVESKAINKRQTYGCASSHCGSSVSNCIPGSAGCISSVPPYQMNQWTVQPIPHINTNCVPGSLGCGNTGYPGLGYPIPALPIPQPMNMYPHPCIPGTPGCNFGLQQTNCASGACGGLVQRPACGTGTCY